jgi:ribosomal-protein-serine acetyltransferase
VSTVTAALFTWTLGDDAALIPRTVAIAEAYHALLEVNYERLAHWFPGGFNKPPTPERTHADLERSGQAWLEGRAHSATLGLARQAPPLPTCP